MERELKQLDKESYLNDMNIKPSKKEEMFRNIRKEKKAPFTFHKRLVPKLIGIAATMIMLVSSADFLKETPLFQSSAQHMADERQPVTQIHFNKQYQSLIGLPNKAVIRGRSNLPEGTVFSVKVYPTDKLDTVIEEKKAVTDEDGNYSVLINREIRDQDYFLTLELLPDQQNETVKEVLGENGVNLKYSKWIDGQVDYYHGNQQYTGIRLYGKIHANDEWTSGQDTWLDDNFENTILE
jgi:hypothetical protein